MRSMMNFLILLCLAASTCVNAETFWKCKSKDGATDYPIFSLDLTQDRNLTGAAFRQLGIGPDQLRNAECHEVLGLTDPTPWSIEGSKKKWAAEHGPLAGCPSMPALFRVPYGATVFKLVNKCGGNFEDEEYIWMAAILDYGVQVCRFPPQAEGVVLVLKASFSVATDLNHLEKASASRSGYSAAEAGNCSPDSAELQHLIIDFLRRTRDSPGTQKWAH